MANDPYVEKLCKEYHDPMWHHDWDRIDASFHPDIVREDTAPLRRYQGFNEVSKFFRESFLPLQIRVNVNWIMAASEGYCVNTLVEAKHVQDVFGILATGKSIAWRVVSIGKVRDGRIIHGIDSWSLNSMLSQLGVSSVMDGFPSVHG